jgi:hypothetical protein
MDDYQEVPILSVRKEPEIAVGESPAAAPHNENVDAQSPAYRDAFDLTIKLDHIPSRHLRVLALVDWKLEGRNVVPRKGDYANLSAEQFVSEYSLKWATVNNGRNGQKKMVLAEHRFKRRQVVEMLEAYAPAAAPQTLDPLKCPHCGLNMNTNPAPCAAVPAAPLPPAE